MRLTDGESVEYGAHNGEHDDGAKVVEEEPIRHEVSGVEDDRRHQVEEEGVRGQRRHVDGRGEDQEESDEDTDRDQKARLGEDLVQPRRHVET